MIACSARNVATSCSQRDFKILQQLTRIVILKADIDRKTPTSWCYTQQSGQSQLLGVATQASPAIKSQTPLTQEVISAWTKRLLLLLLLHQTRGRLG
jgi:hypothetical protein